MKEKLETMCEEACTCKNENASEKDCGCCTDASSEENYGFYSKLLQKPFDTLPELKEAEYQYRVENDAKLKAKEERKKEVDFVKEVITARVEVERKARQAKLEALKIYNTAIKEADEAVKEAKHKEAQALKDFCVKHKEGFHETITIDNMSWRCDYQLTRAEPYYFDPFVDFFKLF